MAKKSISAEARKALKEAREMIGYVEEVDGNEAETRRRVERIFETLMGYDIRHLSREHAVKGAGETEHADFALKTSPEKDTPPVILVELKRVTAELAPKHLRQVSSYAINAGCEWLLLTNGRDWRLYHVEFGQPPITHKVDEWNLFSQDQAAVLGKFDMVSMKQVKKGALDDLWQKTKVLAPESILATVLLEESFRLLRRELKRATGVNVAFEDFVAGFKKMLNESAGITLEKLNIKPPQAKARKPRAKQAADSEESPDAESQEQVIPPSEPADESAVALPPEAQGQNPPDAPTSP